MRTTPNTTCYAYDALHRQTAITYPSGPNASITPPRHFVYDSATVNGQAMQNAHGRLAEAYTGTGSPKITDLGFSYTQRGELADAWQWSTNSSGWYHAAATYWPNGPTGLVKTVTALGLPTWTYNPDGEGRILSVQAGTGYLASDTQYNDYRSGWRDMIVNYGSGDKDTFTFDTNTGRMKQYRASVSTYTVTGNLTWNGNGSLGQMQIDDTAYPANNQTCAYQHDDLARISRVDCGSGHWGQTFAYDAFGNITKTAITGRSSPNFSPGYDAYTNHFTCLSCNYDNNGNMLNDGPVQLGGNTYSWDAEGNLSQFNSGGIIVYDALGRRVEQPGTQIVYGIDGGKLALMNHQTVTNAYAPLPGGGTAVYGGSTLAWYRHPDWLGSSGVGSTTGRAFQYDRSYSPFGDVAWESATVDRNFTGQNQDLTGILYDFPAREYSQGEGRWISPDPAGIAAVDPGNPQSWNRYAYVNNNPLSLIDPTGMDPTQQDSVVRVVEVNGCLYLQNGTRTVWLNPDNETTSYTYLWGGMSVLTCKTSGTGPHGPGGGGETDPSPSQQQAEDRQRKCLKDFYNSRPGKVIEFLSPLSMVWGSDPTKWALEAAAGGLAKGAGLTSAANWSDNAVIVTINGASKIAGPLEGPIASRVVSPLAGGILKVIGKVGPAIPVIAALADATVRAACQSPDTMLRTFSPAQPFYMGPPIQP